MTLIINQRARKLARTLTLKNIYIYKSVLQLFIWFQFSNIMIENYTMLT
jgi:hypothetical protein